MQLRTFSLRTGLILFLVLGAGLGLTARWYHEVRERGEAQLALIKRSQLPRKRGVTQVRAYYVGQESPNWLTMRIREWVHPEYEREFETVLVNCEAQGQVEAAIEVERAFRIRRLLVAGSGLEPTVAARLFRAGSVGEIWLLQQQPIADNVLLSLALASSLESLSLPESIISAPVASKLVQLERLEELTALGCTLEAIPILSRAPALKKLTIESLRHSSQELRKAGESPEEFEKRAGQAMKAALAELSKNPHLEFLTIRGPLGLTAQDWTKFCESSPLKSLTLRTPGISPNCLAEFAKLKNLWSLTIQDDELQDEQLAFLVKAKGVKNILVGPNISREAIEDLKTKMPGVQIARF